MKSTITLAGRTHVVSTEWANGRARRFIDNETIEAFIERMSLLGREDVLGDLARIGSAALSRTLTFDSPQHTAWALHQTRMRAN